MITGTTFTPPDPAEDVDERVARNVQRALEELK
jgi:hypothetical protein